VSPVLVNPSRFATPPSGSTWATEIAADSPILWWRLGEASGTTAADASGHSNTGTYQGSPTFGTTGLISGDTDTAVTFDGVDDRVISGTGISGYPSAAVTIECAFKLTAVNVQQVLLARSDVDAGFGTNWSFYLFVNSAASLRAAFFYGSNLREVFSSALSANTKYVVAARADSSSTDLWVNGSQVSTTFGLGANLNSNSIPVTVGDWYQSGPDHNRAKGVIDEALIFPTKLSNTRLSAHYAAS